jgi:hypothetical protein
VSEGIISSYHPNKLGRNNLNIEKNNYITIFQFSLQKRYVKIGAILFGYNATYQICLALPFNLV